MHEAGHGVTDRRVGVVVDALDEGVGAVAEAGDRHPDRTGRCHGVLHGFFAPVPVQEDELVDPLDVGCDDPVWHHGADVASRCRLTGCGEDLGLPRCTRTGCGGASRSNRRSGATNSKKASPHLEAAVLLESSPSSVNSASNARCRRGQSVGLATAGGRSGAIHPRSSSRRSAGYTDPKETRQDRDPRVDRFKSYPWRGPRGGDREWRGPTYIETIYRSDIKHKRKRATSRKS